MNSILRKYTCYSRNICTLLSNYSTQSANPTKRKLADLFINKDVQKILKKITSVDHEKIFAPAQMKLEPPQYEFVTEKRLKQLRDMATAKRYQKLQMPPVMDVREPINEVLSKDPMLQGYLEYRLIFTDISTNVSPRERMITVREVDGTLRKATWEERDRMNQIYFPIPGRHLEVPQMFESPYLERILDEGSYEFLLDCTCAQFEPDAPDYHRITNQTYEHIHEKKKFHDLRSTRHFGPMAFYFAYQKKIDKLLIDMISRQLISDACDTVRLLYLIHPELQAAKSIPETDEIEILQNYIQSHSSQKDELEKALQTFFEQKKSDLQKEVAI